MTEIHVVIQSPLGLHARPAGEIVKTCRSFASRVRLVCGAKEADARSMLSLLSLGVKTGATVTVRAEGADEAVAATAVGQLLAGME